MCMLIHFSSVWLLATLMAPLSSVSNALTSLSTNILYFLRWVGLSKRHSHLTFTEISNNLGHNLNKQEIREISFITFIWKNIYHLKNRRWCESSYTKCGISWSLLFLAIRMFTNTFHSLRREKSLLWGSDSLSAHKFCPCPENFQFSF